MAKIFRMGDVMRLAKINTINTLNKRNFTLWQILHCVYLIPRYRLIPKP
jgi:hypothetical protein